jgi:hypothetical protein
MRSYSFFFITVLLIPFICGSCAKPEWRHPQKGLAELALDQAECHQLAEAQATSASLGKTRVVREVYNDKFRQCMALRGWSDDGELKKSEIPIISIDSSCIQGFGLCFTIPKGFTPIAADCGGAGPSAWKRHVFSGPGGRSLVLVFQKSTAKIRASGFPAPNGYDIYDKGFAGGVDWTAFTGKQAGVPVACLGAYVPAGPKRRVSVTVVSPLPRAGTPPSSNLVLSDWQHLAVVSFVEAWTDWLLQNPVAARQMP